jgi:hypothetical protein
MPSVSRLIAQMANNPASFLLIFFGQDLQKRSSGKENKK